MSGTVLAVCISERKGTKKHPLPSVILKENYGIIGDSHAGDWHRQISLLADESAEKMRRKGAVIRPGDFAENILTEGVILKTLPVGTHIRLGEAEIKVTQIGKECHQDCEIRKLTGQCVMPKEGVFAVVIRGGEIKPGDHIEIID